MSETNLAVWKYVIDPGTNAIDAPEGCRVLRVGVQDDKVVLWVLVKPETIPGRRIRVKTLMTGETFKESELDGLHYLDTVQLGWIVIHVWVEA